jgi:hypothetical protein
MLHDDARRSDVSVNPIATTRKFEAIAFDRSDSCLVSDELSRCSSGRLGTQLAAIH